VPSFQASVIALATLWGPSIQKWTFYKNGKILRIEEERGEKNGGQVQRELVFICCCCCFPFFFL